MNLIKKLLNIHPDKNQKWLLVSMAISMLLITYSHPMLMKVVISALPAQWIAFESMFFSVGALIIGILWKGNIRQKAIKNFMKLAIIESSCAFLLAMYLCFIDFNVWAYAIGSLIYSTLITTFVGKCLMCFESKLWIDKEREIYDNNITIVSGIVCIIGYAIALIAMPPLKLALFLWGLCCIVDDVGWLIVYFKNKEIFKNIED